MKHNFEESEKKKSQEKIMTIEVKLKEKEKLDKDFRNYELQQRNNRLKKIKEYVEGIKSDERHKEIARIREFKFNQREDEKILNEVSNIFRREDEAEKERKTKQNKLQESVNFTLYNQLIEKKHKMKSEKEIKNKIEKDFLRSLDETNGLEKEKLINKRMKMNKYKEELEEQLMKRNNNNLNEMSLIERRLNKQIIEEMMKYNPPLHNSTDLK